MPVAGQRDPGTGLIGDGQEGAGAVLIQHAGFIREQQITRAKPGFLARAAVDRAGDRVHIVRLNGARHTGRDQGNRPGCSRVRPGGPNATVEASGN